MRANSAVWATLAAIVLVIVGPFIVFVLRDLAHAPHTGAAADVFLRWQTLLAGLLALVGAAVAALVVVRQIETARKTEEDRREARARALWIRLTQELSNLEPYLNRCAAVLTRMHMFLRTQPNGNLVGAFEVEPAQNPPMPRYVIENITALIEVCRASEVDSLSEFAINLQVQSDRLIALIAAANGTSGDIVTREHLIQSVVYIGEIQWYRDSLISYARSTRIFLPSPINSEKVSRSIMHVSF